MTSQQADVNPSGGHRMLWPWMLGLAITTTGLSMNLIVKVNNGPRTFFTSFYNSKSFFRIAMVWSHFNKHELKVKRCANAMYYGTMLPKHMAHFSPYVPGSVVERRMTEKLQKKFVTGMWLAPHQGKTITSINLLTRIRNDGDRWGAWWATSRAPWVEVIRGRVPTEPTRPAVAFINAPHDLGRAIKQTLTMDPGDIPSVFPQALDMLQKWGVSTLYIIIDQLDEHSVLRPETLVVLSEINQIMARTSFEVGCLVLVQRRQSVVAMWDINRHASHVHDDVGEGLGRAKISSEELMTFGRLLSLRSRTDPMRQGRWEECPPYFAAISMLAGTALSTTEITATLSLGVWVEVPGKADVIRVTPRDTSVRGMVLAAIDHIGAGTSPQDVAVHLKASNGNFYEVLNEDFHKDFVDITATSPYRLSVRKSGSVWVRLSTEVFTVRPYENTVDALKKALKKEKENALKAVDANTLVVCAPRGGGRLLRESAPLVPTTEDHPYEVSLAENYGSR